MKLKGIRLINFKGFKDSGWIYLRDISLLFGLNSSGKTSILNALLMLKQSLENPAREIPFTFSMKTDGVDIGTYDEVIHNGIIDNNNPIEIRLLLQLDEDSIANDNLPLKYNQFEVRIQIGYIQKYDRIVVLSFQINRHNKNIPIFKYYINSRSQSVYYEVLQKYEDEVLPYLSNGGVIWHNFLPIIDNEKLSKHIVKRIIDNIRKYIVNYFKNLVHIGPLRKEIERYYQFYGDHPRSVGVSGQEALKMLYLDRLNKESILSDSVQKWMKSFFNYSFQWNTYRGLFQLMFNSKTNAKDVGFGVSQLLPIIVQGFYDSPGQMILVEQPEIHLHPRAQSDLADLFLDISKRCNKQLLVETHSEHLLLRLRRRILESTLSKMQDNHISGFLEQDSVSINFVQHENNISRLNTILLSDKGEFVDPPQNFSNFFSDDFEETMKMLITTSKIKQIEGQKSHD